MSIVGYTIFGRPVQHEYVSNGLFNELNLNSESYLSDRISLQKGQSIAILKRFNDKNGIEVIVVFVNTFAVSYNDRDGGFVGAGIAFIGAPTKNLIYHRIKQLHEKALTLVDQENYKFKVPKIDRNNLKLPDLSEQDLFINKTPRKYKAKDNLVIGVKIYGNFFENLMGAIQGFTFNDSYYSVKTAYVSNNENLLKSMMPLKSIRYVYDLVDYSNVLSKYKEYISNERTKLKEDSYRHKKQIDDWRQQVELENNKRKQDIDNSFNELKSKELEINKLLQNKESLKRDIENYKSEESILRNRISSLENEKRGHERDKSKLLNDLRSEKQKRFDEIIHKPEFLENIIDFKNKLIEEHEKEQKKWGTNWFKLVLIFATVLFFMSSVFLLVEFYRNNSKLDDSNIKLANTQDKLKQFESINSYINNIPVEVSTNDFFKKEIGEKNNHKLKLKKSIELISSQKSEDTELKQKVLNNLLKREWNFREVIYENVPEDIMGGLNVLDKLKNHSEAKKNKLLYEPLFILNELAGKNIKEKKIRMDKDNDADYLLREYLGLDDNIYDNLEILYTKPEEGKSYQDSDPVFLMHFRWMIYNYKNQKKDFYKLKKGDEIFVPVLK